MLDNPQQMAEAMLFNEQVNQFAEDIGIIADAWKKDKDGYHNELFQKQLKVRDTEGAKDTWEMKKYDRYLQARDRIIGASGLMPRAFYDNDDRKKALSLESTKKAFTKIVSERLVPIVDGMTEIQIKDAAEKISLEVVTAISLCDAEYISTNDSSDNFHQLKEFEKIGINPLGHTKENVADLRQAQGWFIKFINDCNSAASQTESEIQYSKGIADGDLVSLDTALTDSSGTEIPVGSYAALVTTANDGDKVILKLKQADISSENMIIFGKTDGKWHTAKPIPVSGSAVNDK